MSDKDLCEYLDVKWPIMPTLYALPKVHKNLTKPPGRPIVSGIGCHTETTETPCYGTIVLLKIC